MIQKGILLLMAGLASIAVAQKQVGTTLRPVGVQQVASSSIDTNDFVVRIDETFNYQPVWPENPVFRNEGPSKPNGLKVGGLLKDSRGVLGAYFPAISATGWTPPDPDIAVGPNHILAVVNSSLAWFDKSGVKQLQQTAQTFFTGMGAGSFQFDPKCFYDRVNQRFVLIYLEQDGGTQTSKVLLAVSDDNDPNGTWHRYRLEAKLTISNLSYWLDYPGFGYNKDAYVICGNMFGFSNGFAGVQFIVVPSAPLLSGGVATATSIRDAAAGSAQIAEMISPTEPRVYAAARNGSTGLKIYSVNDPGGTPVIQSANVTVPSNSGPTMDAASTNNRSLDTIDSRIYNVTWRNGSLVLAHNIQSGNFVAARWYQVDTNGFPSGTPTLAQSGNVSSGTQHYFVPAISINAQGSISTVFTGSSTTIPANLNFAGRVVGDAAGVMGAPQLLEASAGDNYSQGRWGDYFGVDVDPTDNYTFWGIGMTISPTNSWRTSIFSWRVGPPPTALMKFTLSSFEVPGGNSITGTLLLTNPAPFGGATVALSSNSTNVNVPATVTVPAGATQVAFTINTTPPEVTHKAIISASFNGAMMSAVFVVHAPPPVNPTITNLSIHPNSVLGGVSTTGTVTLTGPATSGGITVSLSSDNSFATVPQTVTVPEGATSVDFVVTTTLPPTAQMATISATHGNNTKTAVCQVRSN
jgi:hypothetical protein